MDVVDGFKFVDVPLAPLFVTVTPDAVNVVPVPELEAVVDPTEELEPETEDAVVEPDAEDVPAVMSNSSDCARMPEFVVSVETRSTR